MEQSHGLSTTSLKPLPDVIAEYDSSGALLAYLHHGAGIDEVISMRRGGNSYFYLTDALGTITLLTDQAEGVANNYDHDSFGKVLGRNRINL